VTCCTHARADARCCGAVQLLQAVLMYLLHPSSSNLSSVGNTVGAVHCCGITRASGAAACLRGWREEAHACTRLHTRADRTTPAAACCCCRLACRAERLPGCHGLQHPGPAAGRRAHRGRRLQVCVAPRAALPAIACAQCVLLRRRGRCRCNENVLSCPDCGKAARAPRTLAGCFAVLRWRAGWR
jgi:hypothetical protein